MFTGRTLFLTPNQQCQSTEGTENLHSDWLILLGLIKDKMRSLPQHTAQYLAIQSAAGSRAAGETAAADCLAIHTEGSVTQQPRQPATVSLLSNATHTSLSSRVVSASDCGVRASRFESRRWQLCLSRHLLRYTVLSTGCAPLLQCLGRLSLPPSVER